MRVSIVTLFPEYFDSPLKTSVLGRAIESKALEVDFVGLRSFGEGPYRAVDDSPYGGGVGMVLLPTVFEKALGPGGLGLDLDALEKDVQAYRAMKAGGSPAKRKTCVVALTPQGKAWTSKDAERLAADAEHVVVLCGHYEGFDERIVEAFAHEEISIGDYVLTGGEPAAAVLLDSLSRFIPGVVGKSESVRTDTFGQGEAMAQGGLKHAQYTKPLKWRGREVPEVLASGHHEKIRRWREQDSADRTALRRPDLLRRGGEYPAYVALLHHPMLNRVGEEVCTAVTNLDLHDIARSCRTYGLKRYFVVNPEPEQEKIVSRILGHWDGAVSKAYHPARAEALSGIRFLKTFDEVLHAVAEENAGQKPFVVMPDARNLKEKFPGKIPIHWAESPWSYRDLREKMRLRSLPERRPLLIVFGTGWGISPSFFEKVDQPLAPLRSNRPYNHLSVRAAAAIVLDRLFGSN